MESADAVDEDDNTQTGSKECEDSESVEAEDEEFLAQQLLLEVFDDGSEDEAVAFDDFIGAVNSDGNTAADNACSDWTWRGGSCQPHTVDFSEEVGSCIQSMGHTPFFNFLKQLVTTDMLENIVTETNRYAEHAMKNASYSSGSTVRKWLPADEDRLWTFLGLLTAMKFIQVDNFRLYWSTDILYSFPFFGAAMSRDHFHLLLQFLHLSNNADPENRGQTLSKIKPFLDKLQANFQFCYKPRQHLALGEAFILWKSDHTAQTQSQSGRQSECYGVKVYELIDTYNGYCCGFHLCDTKGASMSPGVPSSVVMQLMKPYFKKGYHLYIGTYCDSPSLYRDLAENGVLACGPVKAKQKGLGLISSLKLVNEGDFRVSHCEKVNHVKVFMQGKEMDFLTTIHASKDFRKQQNRPSPSTGSSQFPWTVVEDYNKFMNILDQYDLTVQENTFKKKKLKWWKKIFCQFFSLAQSNAYLLYCDVVMESGQRPQNKRLFHEELAKEMVTFSFSQRKYKRSSVPAFDDLNRLTARHFMSRVPVNEEYDPVDRRKKKFKPKNCAVCHGLAYTRERVSKPRRRRETIYECRECGVPLCPMPCFKLYHTERHYKDAYLMLGPPEEFLADEQQDPEVH